MGADNRHRSVACAVGVLCSFVCRFVFIFLGIAAFSTVNGFNSIINSLAPITAGAFAAAKKPDMEKVSKSLRKSNDA